MEYPWIRIEDLSRFTIKELKQYHPDDPRHTEYWRGLKLRCIEGVWGEDFGKLRYMPGRLFFYGHFCSILDVDEEEKIRRIIKPDIRDLEWERSYMYLEADGFSGWSNDELYTSEHSIKKIRKNYDPLKVTSNPRYFKSNGDFKEFIPPKENIRMLHDVHKGRPLYYNNCSNLMELGSRGGGKMTSVEEPVLTTKGWVKMGDLKVGDFTYGRNGKPTKIIQIHPQGVKRIWRVTLQDDRKLDCGDEHLWTVRLGSGIEKVISTKEMYEKGLVYNSKKGNIYKYRVPNCKPIEYKEKNLPIDPYLLGCLLGDGCLTTATPKIASSDKFIIDQFREKLPDFEIKYDTFTTNNYTLVDKNKAVIEVNNRWGTTHLAKVKNRLTLALEKLELAKSCKFKFIPKVYKFSSVEQRMELLRGLIDTDGCVNENGSIEFTNTNELLLNDVAELCRSLGIRCKKSIDKRAGQKHNIKGHDCTRGICWRLFINTTLPIAKLPRKLEKITKNHTLRQDFVSIVDIQKTEEFVEQQCITVDNEDHTYITTDYIVTHNSYYYSLAGAKYRITFDGAKVYNEETRRNPGQVTIAIGSGRTDKSSDFAAKIEDSMNRLAIDNNLGAWGKLGDEDYQPSPFFKDMAGSLRPNNKENPWRHSYEMNINGRWVKGFGTGSAIQHVSYSANKKEGAEAAAGGRYTDVIIEETGLCFAKGTEVRMYDFSCKNIEDVKVGDLVMGDDGSPRKVKTLSSGTDLMFKVTQKNGEDYIVNSRHKLCLYDKYQKKHGEDNFWYCEARDFVNLGKSKKREQYGYKTTGLQFNQNLDLVLHPYLLGIWLGDGNRGCSGISINLEKDIEVFNKLKELAGNREVSIYDKGTVPICRIKGLPGDVESSMQRQLKNLNLLRNKHIPNKYLLTSKENRLQLLAGIIDSDGYYGKPHTSGHHYEIGVSRDTFLANQIVELSRSLGFRTELKERICNKGYGNKIIEPRTKYRIYITGDIWNIPVNIARKKASVISYKKRHLNTSIKVECVGKGEYYGFELEDNPLFLLKDFTVVHNTEKVIEAYNSNRATVTVGTNQFGVQVFLGTSGNMETIQNTRKMFTRPGDYEILNFPDYWEGSGRIGFFLPAYMTARQYKDKNGNTDIEAAKAYYKERRDKAAQSEDPSILRVERMNYPIVPSDMWQSEKGNILPSQEAEEREKVLVRNNLYQKLGTPIKLFWSEENMRGIDYEIDHNAEPFYDWPIEGNRKSVSGSILIYDHPFERNGRVADDMYFFTHDPYVSDEIDKGGSLGTIHVWLSPKYWNTHMPATGPLVATYIGKAPNGKKEFYRNVEKLMHYYGNPIRGLAYEANRGEYCRSYFKINKKLNLLALRPHHTNTQSIYAPTVTQYGYMVGNKIQKIEMLDDTSDFLLQEIEIAGETKKLIHTLPCIFTLRQIRSFDLDGNFDAVSSVMLAPIYVKELEHRVLAEVKAKKGKRNPIGFLSANKRFTGYEK